MNTIFYPCVFIWPESIESFGPVSFTIASGCPAGLNAVPPHCGPLLSEVAGKYVRMDKAAPQITGKWLA
jgi:hypothetical protein